MSCAKANLPVPATLLVRHDKGSTEEIPLEQYVKGSLPAYLEPGAPEEALKALSIAIRSCAAVSRRHARDGFDLCTGSDCPAWRPEGRSLATDQAVDGTAGQVLAVPQKGTPPEPGPEIRLQGRMRLVLAPFFERCDGQTRGGRETWNVPLGHCLPVACMCGNRELQGHGVGLCVAGAVAMAHRGASAQEILEHYYTGARVATAATVDRGRLCQSLILGRVVDSAGHPRPGVSLALSGPAGPFRRAASADGRFWFGGLPSGDWTLAVAGTSTRQAGLHTDGRGTQETQVVVPGLPPLELETVPLAHPRALIGTLGYGGVPVTLTGSDGVETTVESGSAPEFDPGGFVAPVPPAGPCTVAVLGQRFTVEIGRTGLWLRFVLRETPAPVTEPS